MWTQHDNMASIICQTHLNYNTLQLLCEHWEQHWIDKWLLIHLKLKLGNILGTSIINICQMDPAFWKVEDESMFESIWVKPIKCTIHTKLG